MLTRFCFLVMSIAIACSGRAQTERTTPEKAIAWQPKEFEEATLYPRLEFLEPAREWERMDIWVPKEPARGKLPCVVAVYGGGYGEKVGGFIKDARPLLKRGFVVAAPDYALQTDAAVPLCSWDVAAAIRYLRANAEKFRIDPERIGIWGWSAGGWIAQDLCYAGPGRIEHTPAKVEGKKVSRWFPMLEPRPVNAEQSVRVQAVVSDWGAQKLWEKRERKPRSWLSPDDPPLFTVYNEKFSDELINPVMLTRKLGIPSSAVYEMQGNTHVPNLNKVVVTEDGRATTWGESIYDFLERRLKNADTATAPEMLPHGGPISGTTKVRLLSVHPTGTIHYTLDGSEPGKSSPAYETAMVVKPGQTMKAVALREGLKPSRVTSGEFVAGPARPLIAGTKREFEAEVGKPFHVYFTAKNSDGGSWFVGGRTGEHYREFDGERFNPPRHIRWLEMDPESGVLSGTPRVAGVYPVMISCMTPPLVDTKLPATGDAVMVVVRVE